MRPITNEELFEISGGGDESPPPGEKKDGSEGGSATGQKGDSAKCPAGTVPFIASGKLTISLPPPMGVNVSGEGTLSTCIPISGKK